MPSTTPTWDPGQYLRHSGHRARPFADLLARVPEPPAPKDRPLRVADLGCGPGNVTRLLAERWPTAHITGLDNSPEMLRQARRDHAGPTAGGGRLDFAHADARDWTPSPGGTGRGHHPRPQGSGGALEGSGGEPYDLIITNATLQWVPGHPESFPAWLDGLAPGGSFAFQVPGNFDAPSHALMRKMAESERWKDRLAGLLRHADAVLEPAEYLHRLTTLGCSADVWETTYLHLLTGDDPVLDWVKGTGLRPVLTALADDPAATEAFLAEYRDLLRQAYPATEHGTVLPFRRIFAVATKPRGAEAAGGLGGA